ncbi:MAG TPA: lipocalin-like domain-containing protein [Thermoanaerobaculia bacterium]|nr:lipocalin-like domain-containing protein [Thermoanaerobaculia bacterium]
MPGIGFARAMKALSMRLLLLLIAPVASLPAADRPGSDGYLLALPGYEFAFPRDHGSHEGYRTEWWYFTGHLTSEKGRRYGFELTFFQVGTPAAVAAAADSRWAFRHLALAHFAITDPTEKQFRYYEKANRVSPFTAGAAATHLDVFNEGWRATTSPNGSWRLVAAEGGDAIDLALRASKPPAVHGTAGVSIKAPIEGFASHYYSMSRLEVEGTLRIRGREVEKVRGLAWMDHEFGSSALRESQVGWDWFSVQLENDTELMLYIIRRRDGSPDVTSSGSLITPDGAVIRIGAGQMAVRPLRRWRSSASGATYPMGWQIDVPGLGVSLALEPVLENQELITRRSTGVTYWEGAVRVSGSSGNVAVRGVGYVEMTGYDRAVRLP